MLRNKNSTTRRNSVLRESSGFRMRSNYTYVYRAGILSAFVLFLLCTHLLLPISVDTNVAEGAATPSTTTLAINTNYSSANLDFTTISSTGTFASSSAEDIAKFTVTTNNYTGYTLTLAGNDDTGQLNNISAGAALDSIATSGVESSSFSTNEWGYLPSKYNSETNTTKYYSAPTTSDADTLDVTNAANSTANEYTIGLGAKVDYSKPAGTYTNTFSVIATANPISYTINYLDNSGDTNVTNLPSPQAAETTATTVTLAPYGSTTPDPEDVPLRPDHEFLGWCSVPTTKNGTMCSGDILNTGDTIEIDQTKENTTNLYAYWLSTKSNYIQDYTKTTCSTEAVDSPITLVDKRDNKEYTVRYISGNCWMTQNLAYMGDTVGSSSTATTWYLKSTTSNVSADKTMTMTDLTSGNSYTDAKYHLATSGQVPSGADFTATDIGVWYNYAAASAMNIATDSNSTQASESVCPAGWRLPTNDEQVTIGNSSTAYVSAFSPVYSGYYFNGSPRDVGSFGFWWSSTAYDGTARYNMYYTSGYLHSSNFSYRNLGYSVRCIRMPYSTTITFDGNGATGGSMENQTISGDSIPSGTLINNGFAKEGYVFVGWNTAADGSGTSYNGTYTAASTSETSRTLYAQWAPSAGTMQNYTKSTCQANASSAPVYLTDKRDDKVYRARYINGNCWMVDNLRFIGNTGDASGTMTLDSTTSNVASTYTESSPQTILYSEPTSGSSYDQAMLHISTNTSYGVYYNYAAATAMTITGYSNSTNSTYDICPKGWRLPTSNEQATIGSSAGNYVSTWLPVYAGFYHGGPLDYESSHGAWWSSTQRSTTDRYIMYSLSAGIIYSGSEYGRHYELSVRCIAEEDMICFPAGTEVTVSMDGATKPIEDIKVGDEVLSYDPDAGEYYMTEVMSTVIHDGDESAASLAEIVLDDNTKLTMTENHPILTKEGYKSLKDEDYPLLTEDDIVITTTGERTIKSIEVKDVEPTTVYNFTVKGRDGDTDNGPTHSYIANGVVVHNTVCGSWGY